MKLSEKTLQKLKDLTKNELYEVIEKEIIFGELSVSNFVDSGFNEDKKLQNFLFQVLDNNILSFQELVDRYRSIKDECNDPNLYKLFWKKDLFRKLFKSNTLTVEDLKYTLNKIDNADEITFLCFNTPVIKKVLSEFMLDYETVMKFDAMLSIQKPWWFIEDDINKVFDLIENFETHSWGEYELREKLEKFVDKKLLKLVDLNRALYKFELNKEQKLKVAKVLKNNEIAQNRVKEIIENQLESNYDFESLIGYLKKTKKKKFA